MERLETDGSLEQEEPAQSLLRLHQMGRRSPVPPQARRLESEKEDPSGRPEEVAGVLEQDPGLVGLRDIGVDPVDRRNEVGVVLRCAGVVEQGEQVRPAFGDAEEPCERAGALLDGEDTARRPDQVRDMRGGRPARSPEIEPRLPGPRQRPGVAAGQARGELGACRVERAYGPRPEVRPSLAVDRRRGAGRLGPPLDPLAGVAAQQAGG